MGVRREQAKKSGSTVHEEHDRAISLYSQTRAWIERLSKRGLDVDHYREALPEWQAALFSFDAAWSSQPNGQAGISNGNIRLLRSLATLIETAEAYRGQMPDPQRDVVRSILEQARSFVENEERFSAHVSRYLLGTLDDVKDALNRGDDAAALAAFSQFTGTLLLLAAEVEMRGDTGAAQTWRERASHFASEVAIAVTANALAAGGVALGIPI